VAAAPRVNKDQIGSDKLVMSAIVVIGIIIFSLSGHPSKEEEAKEAPGGVLVTIFLYGAALVL
jgi:hypothetical protein